MTNKVKFKLKITGFELEMEGTKESTAAITSQVSDALRGLITPPSINDDPESNGNGRSNHTEDTDATIISSSTNGGKKKKSKPTKQNSGAKAEPKAFDFKNEPEKYGTPVMKWSTTTKAIWILYVVKNTLNVDGLTSQDIAETFNKHYKQAKMIKSFTISRDLGRLKVVTNAKIGEDTTKNPPTWYITDAGEKHIQNVIEEQKSKGNGAS